MDILSDVLRTIRISGAVLFQAEFSAPFSVSTPPSRLMAQVLAPDAKRLILFHIVSEGECWIEQEGSPQLPLAAGDVIVLPYGDAHCLADSPGREAISIAALLPRRPWSRLPRVVHGGGGVVTRILCGFLHADDLPLHPLLAGLPPALRVRPSDTGDSPRLEAIIRYTLDEACAARPGGECLLTRLVEVLFVEILRRHMEDMAADQVKPLAALRDPVVRRALESLHAEIEKSWTLEELARRAGTSRSVLAERFKSLMGCPPMQYLSKWRLQVAAHCLTQPHEATAAVAARVGYVSEAAFNRAFKRYAGEPPGMWRRRFSGV